jgi:hypothetical protein
VRRTPKCSLFPEATRRSILRRLRRPSNALSNTRKIAHLGDAPSSHGCGRVGGRRQSCTGFSARLRFPPAATSNRACSFPAHGSPTSFTATHSAFPTRAGSAMGHDAAVEGDQSQAIGRVVGYPPPAVASLALVALGHEISDARERVGSNLVEVSGRTPVAEIAHPTTQKPVKLLHGEGRYRLWIMPSANPLWRV